MSQYKQYNYLMSTTIDILGLSHTLPPPRQPRGSPGITDELWQMKHTGRMSEHKWHKTNSESIYHQHKQLFQDYVTGLKEEELAFYSPTINIADLQLEELFCTVS